MRLLALFLTLLPALASAQSDWLSLPLPQPLTPGARAEIGVAVRSGESYGWAQGDADARYTDPLGLTQTTLKTVELDLLLRARLGASVVLELQAPLQFNELSPHTYGGATFTLQDPLAKRQQGFGDLRLALRGPLTGAPGGFQSGWSLGMVAPTGQGPFDSPDMLLATGEGRWQALAGLVLGGGEGGTIESWLWVQGRWQAPRPAWVSSQAWLAYNGSMDAAAPRGPLNGGSVMLDPRWGVDASYGLAWNWYRDGETRHSLAVELVGHGLTPWSMDGQDQGAGPEGALYVQPELITRFGRFNASGGWRSATLNGSYNVPDFYYGTVLVNAAYAF
jgi:hypothetical protein